jgi:hypothetical protein
MRVLAWLCVLVVLFSVAVPAASASAILPPLAGLFQPSSLVTFVGASPDAAPPDAAAATTVPARAPPLA